MKKIVVASLLAMVCFLGSNGLVRADDCENSCTEITDKGAKEECVNKKVACLEGKIRDIQGKGESLKDEIDIFNSRIALTEAQIEQTKFNQVKAELAMEEAGNRAASLSAQLDEINETLTAKINEAYRLARTSPLTMFLRENGLTDFITAQQKEKIVQDSVAKTMLKKMNDKISYEARVDEEEEKKVELAEQEKTLARQQTLLTSQKQEKDQLLAQTKGEEATYQNLLKQARAEIDSYARFAQSQGGGTCLGASPGGGEGGWFYSQRDPRWCRQYIGRSSDTIGSVGCLLSSVAMIWAAHGQSISPASLAANNAYFSVGTAFLRLPPPVPAGFSFQQFGGYNQGKIDAELAAGRPVIVGVLANNSAGTHFLVLKSGSGGNYKMNDPWNGADLNFSAYYSTGLIFSTRIFTR